MQNNLPSVDDLQSMHETITMFLQEAGFGPLFQSDPGGDVSKKQVNQFCLSFYVPVMLKMIDKFERV